MNATNALAMTQIALQLATQLQQLISSQAQAAAEGRDVSDGEVTDAATSAAAAIAALQAMKRAG
jgi:hypothetical protein